jgi:GxxExxY protein
MYEDLTYKINGGLFTVHNALGNLWKEEVYEQALEMELEAQGLKAERQKAFEVSYFDRRVGHYQLDLLVEDLIIVELKAVSEICSLHQAQLISYLKGYNKPLGILANFGGTLLQHQTFPNQLHLKTPLRDDFDFDKIRLKNKHAIKDLLLMANRILITLGAGYFHQIYRRAFYYELKQAQVEFEVVKEIAAMYRNKRLDAKEVNFFIIGDLLLSVVAVQALTSLAMSRFRSYLHYFHLKRGLIFNFNALRLDFRYVEL